MGISSSQTWNPRLALSILPKITQLGRYPKSAFNREPVALHMSCSFPRLVILHMRKCLEFNGIILGLWGCEFESWLNRLGAEPSRARPLTLWG